MAPVVPTSQKGKNDPVALEIVELRRKICALQRSAYRTQFVNHEEVQQIVDLSKRLSILEKQTFVPRASTERPVYKARATYPTISSTNPPRARGASTNVTPRASDYVEADSRADVCIDELAESRAELSRHVFGVTANATVCESWEEIEVVEATQTPAADLTDHSDDSEFYDESYGITYAQPIVPFPIYEEYENPSQIDSVVCDLPDVTFDPTNNTISLYHMGFTETGPRSAQDIRPTPIDQLGPIPTAKISLARAREIRDKYNMTDQDWAELVFNRTVEPTNISYYYYLKVLFFIFLFYKIYSFTRGVLRELAQLSIFLHRTLTLKGKYTIMMTAFFRSEIWAAYDSMLKVLHFTATFFPQFDPWFYKYSKEVSDFCYDLTRHYPIAYSHLRYYQDEFAKNGFVFKNDEELPKSYTYQLLSKALDINYDDPISYDLTCKAVYELQNLDHNSIVNLIHDELYHIVHHDDPQMLIWQVHDIQRDILSEERGREFAEAQLALQRLSQMEQDDLPTDELVRQLSGISREALQQAVFEQVRLEDADVDNPLLDPMVVDEPPITPIQNILLQSHLSTVERNGRCYTVLPKVTVTSGIPQDIPNEADITLVGGISKTFRYTAEDFEEQKLIYDFSDQVEFNRQLSALLDTIRQYRNTEITFTQFRYRIEKFVPLICSTEFDNMRDVWQVAREARERDPYGGFLATDSGMGTDITPVGDDEFKVSYMRYGLRHIESVRWKDFYAAEDIIENFIKKSIAEHPVTANHQETFARYMVDEARRGDPYNDTFRALSVQNHMMRRRYFIREQKRMIDNKTRQAFVHLEETVPHFGTLGQKIYWLYEVAKTSWIHWFFVIRLYTVYSWWAVRAWYYTFMLKREIDHWLRAIGNFFSKEPLSKDDVVRLTEVKSALHSIHHIYTGNKAGLLESLSYFGLTRRDQIISLVQDSFETFTAFIRDPKATINILGCDVEVDSKTWEEVVRRYETNPLDPDYTDIEPQTEVHGGNPFMTLWNYVFPENLDFMSQERLREMNNQFTFLRHKQQRFDAAYDAGCLILSVLGRTFLGIDPFDPEYVKFVTDMVDIVEYTRSAKLQSDSMITNRHFMKQIQEKFDIAAKMYVNPKVNTAPKFLQSNFRTAYVDLEVLCKEATSYIHGNKERMEPLSILMTGSPNGGKTAFTKQLMRCVARLEGKSFDPSQLFTMPANAVFWDGYAHQDWVSVDDLYKLLDKESRAAQSAMIVELINTAPLSLNMAKCESKGNVYFDSKYVVWSTNIANEGLYKTQLQVQATDNDAIIRRFHIVIHKSTKIKGDLFKESWRVDKCPFPEYVTNEGEEEKLFSTADIYHMIYKARVLQVQTAKSWEYTDEQLDELMGIKRDNVELHSGPIKSLTTLFSKMCYNGLYDWQLTNYRTHFVLLFAILTLAAIASPIYRFCFPVTTTSDPIGYDEDDKATIAKAKAEAVQMREIRRQNLEEQNHWGHSDRMRGTEQRINPRSKNVQLHSADLNCSTAMVKSISKSLVYLVAKSSDPRIDPKLRTTHSSCVGMHVKDGWVVTCAHWFNIYIELAIMGQPIEFTVRTVTGEYKVPFPAPNQVKEAMETDMVMIKLDKSIPPLRETSRFLNHAQHAHHLQPGTKLQMLRVDSTCHPIYRKVTICPGSPSISYSADNTQFFVDSPIMYHDVTRHGESGAVLIAEGNQGAPIIVGMHAGYHRELLGKNISFAVPFLKEQLFAFIEGSKPPVVVDTGVELHAGCLDSMVPHDPEKIKGFPAPILGVLPPDKATYVNDESKILKSVMHGWNGKPKKVPAKLRSFTIDGKVINPAFVALGKVRHDNTPPIKIGDNVMAFLKHTYPQPYYEPKVLNLDEAINGIPERKIPAIKMSTSPGYPYVLKRTTPGKTSFIVRDNTDGRLYMTEVAAAEFNDILKAVQNLEDFEVIWMDALKDETRPEEKVKQGKTRLVSSSPLHMLLLERMYFADFVAYVQSTPATKPVSVGLNVHSNEWRILYERLAHTNESVISGDFSAFDSTVPEFVIKEYVDFVNWWYDDGEHNAAIRHHIMSKATNATHLFGNIVYKACDAVCSGEAITSNKNSFCGFIATHDIITNDLQIPEDAVNYAFYGDDSVITIGIPGFSWKDLAPHYDRKYRMKFTHCSKEDVEVNDTLETITYLGRKFVARQYAPLDLDVVVEMTYWRKGDQHADEILVSTAECFFMELSHHREKVFNEYSRKFLLAVKERAPHLLDVITSKKLSFHTYQQRKYNPGPYHVEMDAFYDRHKWTYKVLDGFVCTSGKPDVITTTNDIRSDRTTYEPIETQSTEIGEFRDVGPIEAASIDNHGTQSVHLEQNLEHFSLDDVICRTYTLPQVGWTTAMGSESIIATYLFPDDLFTQSFIADKIKDFCYFTAGVEMTFRVITNKFLYGTLMVDFVPVPTQTVNQPNTLQKCSGGATVILSASSSNTVTYSFPYISPYRWLDLDNYVIGEMGRVRIRVMDPLTDVYGEATSAVVIVTAKFTDPRLYLPTNIGSAPVFTEFGKDRAKYIEEHNKLVRSLQMTTTEELPVVIPTTEAKQSTFYVRERETVDTLSEILRCHGKALEGREEKYIIKEITRDGDFKDVTKVYKAYLQLDGFVVTSGKVEMRSKSSRGVISNSLINSVGVPARILHHVTQQYRDYYTGWNAIMATARVLGLSKPTTQQLTMVNKLNVGSDYVYGKGIDTSLKMCMDPENAITTTPNVAGINHDEMGLLYILMTPSLHSRIILASNSDPTMIFSVGAIPGGTNTTYYNWLSNFFDRWSGSFKLCLYIRASMFHNVSLAFYLTNTSLNPADWEACYNMIVDVQGDTVVKMTIPFISHHVAANVGTYVTQLYVRVLAWNVPDLVANAPVYINLFAATGPDFKFYGHREVQVTVTNNPRADFAEDFPFLHPSMGYYKQEGFVYGEVITTLRELIHRYHNAGTAPGGYTSCTMVATGAFRSWQQWALLFYFWRGSTRHKVIFRDNRYVNTVVLSQGGTSGSNPNYLGNYISSSTNPTLEFEVPYYEHRLMMTTGQSSSVWINLNRTDGWTKQAAGDDFSFLFLHLPPNGTFANSSAGNTQFINFLNSYDPRTVVIAP